LIRPSEPLFTAGNAALFPPVSMTMSHGVEQMTGPLEGSMPWAIGSAADVEGGVSGSLGEPRVLRRAAQVGIAIDRLLGLPDHTVVFVPPGQEQAQL